MDKFLMMFGKYNAREIDVSKIEKIKKGNSIEFDWKLLKSSLFDLDEPIAKSLLFLIS